MIKCEEVKTSQFFALILVFAIGLCFFARPAHALDEVKLLIPSSSKDKRKQYPEVLLTMAMQATELSDGPFVITHNEHHMTRKRELEELISGRLINVCITPTCEEWERKSIPVRIPIYKGLRNYRLLLIDRKKLNLFSQIHTTEDLKKIRIGLGSQWPITSMFIDGGFTVVRGMDYEGLFYMLSVGRFDCFPRGINDIFVELRNYIKEYPDMLIEPTLALHCLQPTFFFVSPETPALADRIRRGLELLVAEGEFDGLFHEWFDQDIEQAQLAERHILYIKNPSLSEKTPLDRSELWFIPSCHSTSSLEEQDTIR